MFFFSFLFTLLTKHIRFFKLKSKTINLFDYKQYQQNMLRGKPLGSMINPKISKELLLNLSI